MAISDRIIELAREALFCFDDKRELRAYAIGWVENLVLVLHQEVNIPPERRPDVWRCKFIAAALEEIAHGKFEPDGLAVPMWPGHLLDWLRTYKFRVWYVNEAKYKHGHSVDILTEIRNGCRMEMEDVFRSVLRCLHEMAECRTAD